MPAPKSSPLRLFSLEGANNTLPLVRSIVRDLDPLLREVEGLSQRVDYLTDQREPQSSDPYSEELAAMQEKLIQDAGRIEDLIAELREICVEFKGPYGHVVYPTMIDGRLACFSWQLGEPEVSHWMELDSDPKDRKSVLADATVSDA